MKNNRMSYEPEADILRIETGRRPIDYATEIGNVVAHFSPEGIPVYFEILEATGFFERASILIRQPGRRMGVATTR